MKERPRFRRLKLAAARRLRSAALVGAALRCGGAKDSSSVASCKKARRDQTPHGADELIILDERIVGVLRGVVSIGYGGRPAGDVVVEIYRHEGGAVRLPESLNGAKRRTACLTTENGRFAFPRLRRGRYLLHAGTVRFMGINQVYAIFKVTEIGTTHDIEIRLPLGT